MTVQTSTPRRSWCGDHSPEHRVKKCVTCLRIYRNRWQRAKRDKLSRLVPAAACAMCGVTQGSPVPVYRYPLVRNVRSAGSKTGWGNRCLASIALCDPCIVEHAVPSPSYMAANGLPSREWPVKPRDNDGLRANDGMPASIAS